MSVRQTFSIKCSAVITIRSDKGLTYAEAMQSMRDYGFDIGICCGEGRRIGRNEDFVDINSPRNIYVEEIVDSMKEQV